MSVIDSIRKQVVPVHREGYVFIAIFAVASVLLGWLYAPLGWLGLVLTIWCVYFFRDPVRMTPLEDGLVIAPADGSIAAVGLVAPPPELGLGADAMQKISIFMSVFDCHVNRAPVAGRIAKIVYKPGLFLNADLDKASENNERNALVIDGPEGRLGVVQIAGLIARRIVCFVREGDQLASGERFGLIRFGSRLDVYLPDRAVFTVSLNSRTLAGETIIADLSGNEVPRSFKAG